MPYIDARTNSEHADWQGRIMKNARMQSDISVGKMAEYLDVSDKTIKNWEKGISSPTIEQTYTWFRTVDVNPMYAIESYMYPDYYRDFLNRYDEHIADSVLELSLDTLPVHEKRILIFILEEIQRWNPTSVLQEMCANLHTPLYDRHTIATLVRNNYDIATCNGSLVRPNAVQPNLKILDRAIEQSTISLYSGKTVYTVAQITENEINNYNRWIGSVLKDARTIHDISASQMAREMDITDRTLHNWENGQSSPTLKDLFKWFRIANINSIYAFQAFSYPELFSDTQGNIFEPTPEIDHQLRKCFSYLNFHEKRIIIFVLAGLHGSSSVSVLQEIITNMQCPLKDRYSVAKIIEHNYNFALITENIVCPNNVAPDMYLFRQALNITRENLLKTNL